MLCSLKRWWNKERLQTRWQKNINALEFAKTLSISNQANIKHLSMHIIQYGRQDWSCHPNTVLKVRNQWVLNDIVNLKQCIWRDSWTPTSCSCGQSYMMLFIACNCFKDERFVLKISGTFNHKYQSILASAIVIVILVVLTLKLLAMM